MAAHQRRARRIQASGRTGGRRQDGEAQRKVFRTCQDGKAPEAPGPGSRLSGQGGGGITDCPDLAVGYLDKVVEELFDVVPRNTYITITSDHGELFGEDGYFGHGPIYHEKVWEVPFVEGKIR